MAASTFLPAASRYIAAAPPSAARPVSREKSASVPRRVSCSHSKYSHSKYSREKSVRAIILQPYVPQAATEGLLHRAGRPRGNQLEVERRDNAAAAAAAVASIAIDGARAVAVAPGQQAVEAGGRGRGRGGGRA
eukprot:scaffold89674_cov60-Phaeocystis_antarctica.AAC.1